MGEIMGCGGMSSGTHACGSWAGHYTDSMIAHHLAIPNVNHYAAGAGPIWPIQNYAKNLKYD